jgi:hypothetical protein
LQRSQLPQGTMEQRITHQNQQKHTRQRNVEDPMEGGRDAAA